MADDAFPEGLEKLERVQRAAAQEVMFLRPVVDEGETGWLSLQLSKRSSGTGPGCSLKGCVKATRASLSSLESVERIQTNRLQFHPRKFRLNIEKSFLLVGRREKVLEDKLSDKAAKSLVECWWCSSWEGREAADSPAALSCPRLPWGMGCSPGTHCPPHSPKTAPSTVLTP